MNNKFMLRKTKINTNIERKNKMLEREKVNNTGFNIENSYSELPQIFYTKQLPSLSQDPKIVILTSVETTSLGNSNKLSNLVYFFCFRFFIILPP